MRDVGKGLAVLVVIGLLSVGLITTTDGLAFRAVRHLAPQVAWIANARPASLLLCLAIYLLTGPGRSYGPPKPDTNWRWVAAISLSWLIPAAFMLFIVHVWVPAIRTPTDVTAFLATGLLAEEFLFRGAIYQMAERRFPAARAGGLPLAAIGISALLFSVQHLQYHHFMLTPAAWSQMASTLLMGIFFGALRPVTGSLWPGVVLHLLNNSLSVLRWHAIA